MPSLQCAAITAIPSWTRNNGNTMPGRSWWICTAVWGSSLFLEPTTSSEFSGWRQRLGRLGRDGGKTQIEPSQDDNYDRLFHRWQIISTPTILTWNGSYSYDRFESPIGLLWPALTMPIDPIDPIDPLVQVEPVAVNLARAALDCHRMSYLSKIESVHSARGCTWCIFIPKKCSICFALRHSVLWIHVGFMVEIVQKIDPVPEKSTDFPGRNAAAHGHGHVQFLAADAANGLRRSWLVWNRGMIW